MNHLFRINQFSPYAKTKDVASMRTIVRKRERNPSSMFWDSSLRGTYTRQGKAINKTAA